MLTRQSLKCSKRIGTKGAAAQHSTAQHSTAEHSRAQHSTAQHSSAQHSSAQLSTAQHSSAQHSSALHCTAQHSIAQHITAQHSIAKRSTAQHLRCAVWQGLHFEVSVTASHFTAHHNNKTSHSFLTCILHQCNNASHTLTTLSAET